MAETAGPPLCGLPCTGRGYLDYSWERNKDCQYINLVCALDSVKRLWFINPSTHYSYNTPNEQVKAKRELIGKNGPKVVLSMKPRATLYVC